MPQFFVFVGNTYDTACGVDAYIGSADSLARAREMLAAAGTGTSDVGHVAEFTAKGPVVHAELVSRDGFPVVVVASSASWSDRLARAAARTAHFAEAPAGAAG
jgi:hypothetical protein